MPALQVRDLPQSLYDELSLRAKREHRSMAQQTVVAIEQHLHCVPAAARPLTEEEERQARIAKRKALFEEIARMRKPQIPDDFPSVVELIREDRDAR